MGSLHQILSGRPLIRWRIFQANFRTFWTLLPSLSPPTHSSTISVYLPAICDGITLRLYTEGWHPWEQIKLFSGIPAWIGQCKSSKSGIEFHIVIRCAVLVVFLVYWQLADWRKPRRSWTPFFSNSKLVAKILNLLQSGFSKSHFLQHPWLLSLLHNLDLRQCHESFGNQPALAAPWN